MGNTVFNEPMTKLELEHQRKLVHDQIDVLNSKRSFHSFMCAVLTLVLSGFVMLFNAQFHNMDWGMLFAGFASALLLSVFGGAIVLSDGSEKRDTILPVCFIWVVYLPCFYFFQVDISVLQLIFVGLMLGSFLIMRELLKDTKSAIRTLATQLTGLEEVGPESSLEIRSWLILPEIQSFANSVTEMQRRFTNNEVEAMRQHFHTWERRMQETERERAIEEACESVYGSGLDGSMYFE